MVLLTVPKANYRRMTLKMTGFVFRLNIKFVSRLALGANSGRVCILRVIENMDRINIKKPARMTSLSTLSTESRDLRKLWLFYLARI